MKHSTNYYYKNLSMLQTVQAESDVKAVLSLHSRRCVISVRDDISQAR